MPVIAALRIIPLLLAGIILPGAVLAADDGSALPFAAAPSASIAAPRLQDSKHQRRVEPPAEGRRPFKFNGTSRASSSNCGKKVLGSCHSGASSFR